MQGIVDFLHQLLQSLYQTGDFGRRLSTLILDQDARCQQALLQLFEAVAWRNPSDDAPASSSKKIWIAAARGGASSKPATPPASAITIIVTIIRIELQRRRPDRRGSTSHSITANTIAAYTVASTPRTGWPASPTRITGIMASAPPSRGTNQASAPNKARRIGYCIRNAQKPAPNSAPDRMLCTIWLRM